MNAQLLALLVDLRDSRVLRLHGDAYIPRIEAAIEAAIEEAREQLIRRLAAPSKEAGYRWRYRDGERKGEWYTNLPGPTDYSCLVDNQCIELELANPPGDQRQGAPHWGNVPELDYDEPASPPPEAAAAVGGWHLPALPIELAGGDDTGQGATTEDIAYINGWNACRSSVLRAALAPTASAAREASTPPGDAQPAAADVGEESALWALRQILADLPESRDWMDPGVEKVARELVTRNRFADIARFDDARRLEWVSHKWGGQRNDFSLHVLKRGGCGELDDIRSFIDDAIKGDSHAG